LDKDQMVLHAGLKLGIVMTTIQHVEQSGGLGMNNLGDSVADGGNTVINHMGIKHEADKRTRRARFD
jgi:hypothetical protein